MRTDEQRRVYEARVEARQLGYSLFVEDVPGSDPSAAYVAAAAPYLGSRHPAVGRPLAHGASAGEAAEAGLEALRAVAAPAPS